MATIFSRHQCVKEFRLCIWPASSPHLQRQRASNAESKSMSRHHHAARNHNQTQTVTNVRTHVVMYSNISRTLSVGVCVFCQKGPICHAWAWRIGPFWQDTLDIIKRHLCEKTNPQITNGFYHPDLSLFHIVCAMAVIRYVCCVIWFRWPILSNSRGNVTIVAADGLTIGARALTIIKIA